MSKTKIKDPVKLIEKQGQAWESENCGELWEMARDLYKSIIDLYVPDDKKMDIDKEMLITLEYSSGCTGLVWLDE